jgi:hypothetical protein
VAGSDPRPNGHHSDRWLADKRPATIGLVTCGNAGKPWVAGAKVHRNLLNPHRCGERRGHPVTRIIGRGGRLEQMQEIRRYCAVVLRRDQDTAGLSRRPVLVTVIAFVLVYASGLSWLLSLPVGWNRGPWLDPLSSLGAVVGAVALLVLLPVVSVAVRALAARGRDRWIALAVVAFGLLFVLPAVLDAGLQDATFRERVDVGNSALVWTCGNLIAGTVCALVAAKARRR